MPDSTPKIHALTLEDGLFMREMIKHGRFKKGKRQTKLQIARQKAFKALKQPILGIKSACSPIESGVTSYEIDSSLFLTATQDQQITCKPNHAPIATH